MKYVMLFLAILVPFIAFKSCQRPVSNIILKTKIDTVYVKKDSIIHQDVLKYKTIKTPGKTDTFNVYLDTVNYDGNSIVVNDTITDNHITGRSLDFKLNEKTIIDSIYIKPKNKLEFYVGPTINTNRNFGIGVYSSYGRFIINSSFNGQFMIGIGYRIK